MKWNNKDYRPNEVYLVLGNGYDIEVGLPTQYTQFIAFLTAIEDDSYLQENMEGSLAIQQEIAEALRSQNKRALEETWHDILDSFWYHHFKKCPAYFDKWVDFEKEIAHIIQIIEYMLINSNGRPLSLDENVVANESDLPNSLSEFLFPFLERPYTNNDGQHMMEYNITYRKLRNTLLHDLNIFIHGFDMYLRDYARIKLNTSAANELRALHSLTPLINEACSPLNRLRILSFNYTDTFEKLFDGTPINYEICHIHGEIGKSKKENNIVMGMDEYLSKEEVKKQNSFASFRKHNQRILKATSMTYMDWLDEMDSSLPSDRLLIIFGHSMGLTDGNIIRPFITQEKMRTIILYYDEDALDTIVTNLTAILDRDDVFLRIGGTNPTMKIICQKDILGLI